MVWIEASASHEVVIYADRAAIMELLKDIPVCGPMFPGVDRIESLGDNRYRWLIKERRTLGTSFVGQYIAEYTHLPDAVSWKTVEGNMKTTGRWVLSGPDRAVRVRAEATTELDAPVPRFLKAPAQLFAVKETRDGLKTQLEGIKAAAETSA